MSPLETHSYKDQFFEDDFSVDQCLSKLIQTANLETLKSHLKNFGDELHRQMAEILKTETEAIVNLAEYLTNLHAKIDDLSISLSQLQEQLKVLHTLIKTAESECKKTLTQKNMNDAEKNGLLARLDFISITLYVDNIIRSIENYQADEKLMCLERAVFKYSFQKNYLAQVGILESNSVILSTENKLLNMIHEQFRNGLKNNNESTVERCLRMYSNLEKQKDAEEFYQMNIVRPALQPLYTEKNLDKFNQDVNKIYIDTLKFLNVEMKILDDILQKNSDLKHCFNFILNSFWIEVDRQCRKGLPHITAPGNPELFQKRFVSTWNFLAEIAKKCNNINLVKTHPSFQDHIKRFNLAVYFEIRFQQIASQFETDLAIKPDDTSIFIGDNDFGFKLKITLDLYVALKKCFDGSVFINQLADHFMKFSMFLLSRYIMWFNIALEQKSSDINLEKFIMNSLVDIKIILDLLGNKENLGSSKNIYAIFPKRMESVISKVFDNNHRILTEFSIKLSKRFVSAYLSKCSEQLQNVTAIPRLFRRTNRNPPREPSTYIVESVKPIWQFYEKNMDTDEDIVKYLLNEVILGISEIYSTLVQDVLQSVCKTEESLRRLKNRNLSINDESSVNNSTETMSDEMKIREQIKLDIKYFITKLTPVTMPTTRDTLDKLNQTL
ncbi:hypothetical protein WA026_004452 [Henosepilachna vigintioctopunctata]|uniref:Conserved oligomeric Golgi complex subunit 2 n=1 Tax=Henosepilachna vigintioctopunctata TaxID=420089 RepID=A0AAW1VAA9_9CUCU